MRHNKESEQGGDRAERNRAPMRLLKASERLARPWKNGGGVTFDVATFPENATLDSFAWRISLAEVASNGPFSLFEGIDRSTAILAGEGFRLAFADGRVEDLRLDGPALAYPGDIASDCTLLAGPVRDLNVMTRREVFRHRLRRVRGEVATEGETVVICPRGSATVTAGGTAVTLNENDALMLTAPRFHSDASLWLAELMRV